MDELLAQFLLAGPELLEQANDALVALERAPGDFARLNDAFRAVHTLKGSVGLFDLPPLESLLHAAEDILSGLREGSHVLDLAGGTGDLARLYAKAAGASGMVVLTDINGAMLAEGRDKLLDAGVALPIVQCNAEALPFADRRFDCVSIAFGLRNVTRKEVALAEMRRVTRPGGLALVLEFSKIAAPLAPAYDWYSFNVLPKLGKLVAGDEASYRYLAESIRMHPDQPALQQMMRDAGFDRVDYYNLAAGVVAVHVGRVH